MAGKLRGYGTTGTTYDFFAFNASNQVWNGSAFTAWVNGSYATYRITATEVGATGSFVGDEPTDAVWYEMRLRAGTLAGSTRIGVGTVENGLTADQDETLDIILGQTSRLSTSGNTFRTPFANGVMTVPHRMSWADTSLAAITIAQDGENWPDLSAYTGSIRAYLTIEPRYTNHASYSTNYATASFPCTVTGTGTNQAILCRPTSTANLMVTKPDKGYGAYPYKAQVWAGATNGGVLLMSGQADVAEDIRS